MPLSDILPLKILIVDDDDLSVAFVETVLRAYGFQQIHGMTDARAVAKWVENERPDLILLDVVMPHYDGFEVLRDIRASLRPDEYLPILMITAEDRQTVQMRALTEGAADFLPKPLEQNEVVLRVCNLLRARQQHLQLRARNAHLDREIRAQRMLADALELTSARLSALLSNLQSGVLVENENRQIVLVNAHFCEMFALSEPPEALIGTNATVFAKQLAHFFADPEDLARRGQKMTGARVIVANEELETADGRTFERDYVPIFHDGKFLGQLWNLRDISERKRFALELEQARDAALESARFKADFLANMSHEIRTPVNGVLGMLGLLADSPLKNEQRSLLKTAQTSADALLHIINDVLDFSKIEAGKLTIEDSVFSPIAVLDDCLETVSSVVHEKGLELLSYFDAGVPGGARGDGARVRQVLTNFLSNALKFTQRGEIVARIEVQNAHLKFSVCDSGIGISAAAAQHLFQPFMQADSSTTRRFGGTGLGLAISRQLVEKMGGEIGVDSIEGQGATFWFTLPLEAVEIPEIALAREQIIALCDARVLVVEDNATIRRHLLQQLDSWQIAAEGARTGIEALQRLRAAARSGRPYDAALLDAQLPDTDAITLAHQIKAEKTLSRTHLLLMTALNAHQEAADLFTASLAKPVRQSQLHDALLQAFQGEAPFRVMPTEIAPRDNNHFTGVKVLLADDNAINREVAWRWLQKWGCETLAVINGREALDAVQNQVFDLVLMDCQMPEMDGYEASRAIRQLETPARDIPIVAVTAHALEGDRQKCLAAGMNDYLSKPIRPASLAEILTRWAKMPAPKTIGEVVISPAAANSSDLEGSVASFGKKIAPETVLSASPEAAPVVMPAPEKVFDTTALHDLHEAVGDEELASFIEMFYEQVSESERLLRQAAEVGDIAALARTAHTLKGVGRQFGAIGVGKACQDLEELIEKGLRRETDGKGSDAPIIAAVDAVMSALAAGRMALHRATLNLLQKAREREQETI